VVFLVLLIPLGVLAFALLMERLEHRLQTGSVSEQDVAEFLDHAKSDEVTTFVKEGWARALPRFRVRSRANLPSRRSHFARWATGRGPTTAPSGPTSGQHAAPRPGAGAGATPAIGQDSVTPGNQSRH
jgi:hypothetical protein